MVKLKQIFEFLRYYFTCFQILKSKFISHRILHEDFYRCYSLDSVLSRSGEQILLQGVCYVYKQLILTTRRQVLT